jgi:outer membrane lipoprotein-sorting protein
MPTGEQILRNVARGMEQIRDYIVDVQAEVHMERMRVPRMQAKMYFKRPNKVHIESQSFALLPREGIALDPAFLLETYDVALIGTDTLEGQKAYKLQLAAKELATRLRQLHLWVEEKNWTILKMETIPYQGRILTVTLRHARQQGGCWLPNEMRVEFETPNREAGDKRSDMTRSPQWEEMQRPLRSGTIHIQYTNYRINTGLNDELFERKEPARKP